MYQFYAVYPVPMWLLLWKRVQTDEKKTQSIFHIFSLSSFITFSFDFWFGRWLDNLFHTSNQSLLSAYNVQNERRLENYERISNENNHLIPFEYSCKKCFFYTRINILFDIKSNLSPCKLRTTTFRSAQISMEWKEKALCVKHFAI